MTLTFICIQICLLYQSSLLTARVRCKISDISFNVGKRSFRYSVKLRYYGWIIQDGYCVCVCVCVRACVRVCVYPQSNQHRAIQLQCHLIVCGWVKEAAKEILNHFITIISPCPETFIIAHLNTVTLRQTIQLHSTSEQAL